MNALTEIQKSIDELEFLHQKLKEEYIRWASNRTDRGIGSINNSVTKEFIQKYTDVYRKKSIKKNLRYISNTIKNTDEKMAYSILREVYFIHPSLHENWFFLSHYNHLTEVIKGRLGLKAYLTSKSKPNSDKTIKGITTFLLKRAMLLENIYSSKLERTLLDFNPTKNVESEIKSLLEYSDKILKVNDVFDLLPCLFRIVHFLLKETGYFPIESLLSNNGWLEYAPCSINEGPIFYKKSEKTRIEIFKECPFLDEDSIREYLREYFEIKEYRYLR